MEIDLNEDTIELNLNKEPNIDEKGEELIQEVEGHSNETEDDINADNVDEELIPEVEGHSEEMEDDQNTHNVEVPAIGMSFDSGVEYAYFCHNYAFHTGFQLFTRTCELLDEFKGMSFGKKKRGEEPEYFMLKRLRLACVRGGKKTEEATQSQVTGCKAYVDARIKSGRMTITVLKLEHNHLMDPARSPLMINYRYMNNYFKKRILNNDAAGVPIKKKFTSLVVESGGPQNLPFNERDMRNVLRIERRRTRLDGDAAAVEAYFAKMKEDNEDFYSVILRDCEGRLMNVFWADARSRAAFKDFGSVVTFDTTHLVNRYRMPFACFVGVNHHGSSVVLGSALISYEDTDSFVWLFVCWKECMGSSPTGILTDQCRAIGKAIEIVFPDVRHRLCLWHILENGARNLGKLKDWEDIKKSMKIAIHDSLTLQEFEEVWCGMVEEFGLQNNSWINDLYAIRRRWVPGYWRDSYWAGMSSTQRSEGINFFFKGYINLNTGLKEFVQLFELAISSKVEEEKRLNTITAERPLRCVSTIVVEEVFHRLYTNAKFKEVQEQVSGLMHTNATELITSGPEKVYEVVVENIRKPVWRKERKVFTVNMTPREFNCSCRLFQFRGILCKHIIRVIEIENIKHIPETYILDCWRKDRIRKYEHIKLHYYDPEKLERFKRSKDMAILNDYNLSLALQNDLAYEILKEKTSEIRKTLECALGISSIDPSLPSGCKVYGKRRIQIREENERYIARGKRTDDGAIKDPPDRRGRGKAPTKRQAHPSEKKKKREEILSRNDEVIQSIFGEEPSSTQLSLESGLHFAGVAFRIQIQDFGTLKYFANIG